MKSGCITVIQKAFIANSKWQVLLTKHPLSDISRPVYDLPGGPVEYAEGLRDSLVKHVLSQTGLTLTTISIPLNIITYLDIANRTQQMIRIIYLCLATGTPPPDKNITWVDSTHNEQYAFPDEGYSKAFQKYLSHSKLSSEEFLDQGILEHTRIYLRQKPQSPFLE